ncbi:MAG: flagellar assembly protein FliW [Spirochaetes bacterium]|nr:flagellar assembly protein FliW [Spirochaetota bacterium]
MEIKVMTRAYGEVTVDENQIIDFPEGILGFDYVKKFVFLEEENSPFLWMQAFDEPELAFVLIRPVDFMGEYNLMISQSDMNNVKAESVSELQVFAIVTIPQGDPKKMTANLQGPIIVNIKMKLGIQAISQSEKYTTKHSIINELSSNEVKEG